MKFLVLIFSLILSFNAIAASPFIWNGAYGKLLASVGLRLQDLKEIRILSVDPTAGAGIVAPVGSLGLRDNSNVGELWSKTGAADTSWSIVRVGLVNLATQVTGVLPIANGGTNKALTLANGGLIYSDADSFEVSAVGTAGQALISGGAGAPSWFAPTAGSVLFAGTSGILAQDNAGLFYDDSTNMLGLGTASPTNKLQIDSGTATASAIQITVGATTGVGVNDGFAIINTTTGIAQVRQREAFALQFFTSNQKALEITSTGSVAVQNAGPTQLATNATAGFLYIPSSAGTPSGTPATVTATVPIEVDTTNNRFYFYSTSAWRTPMNADSSDVMTNKTFNADGTGNSITNIENADIKSGAAIDAAKIADGSVSSTEYQYIGTLSSDAQTQLDAKQARSTLTTKGDLYVATGASTVVRQGIGADNFVLTADASQTNGLRWAAVGAVSVDSYTANHTVNSSNGLLLGDASGGNFTFTLPTAVGIEGATYKFKRTDQTLANKITIEADGTETIDGALTKLLKTLNEEFTLISDGANWQILSHTYPQGWIQFTPSSNANLGPIANVNLRYKRIGSSMAVQGHFTANGTSGAVADIGLPTGVTANTIGSGVGATPVGMWQNNDGTATRVKGGHLVISDGETAMKFNIFDYTSAVSGQTNLNGNQVSVAGTNLIYINALVPITDWEG